MDGPSFLHSRHKARHAMFRDAPPPRPPYCVYLTTSPRKPGTRPFAKALSMRCGPELHARREVKLQEEPTTTTTTTTTPATTTSATRTSTATTTTTTTAVVTIIQQTTLYPLQASRPEQQQIYEAVVCSIYCAVGLEGSALYVILVITARWRLWLL